ncbi:Acetylglutamate kinase [Paraliobacillus sp. PM-2]|uniref:acetylglutamate kinase n=1 Tax=Paraliobacillus sp. PM-2 TaxID=1462524 RepID=UPI00061BA065|nr:acetylglutamate kinase [Paraliobacillus sp. PM-2]CQR46026.1 Acetylglutamate kinase [Paraliobacillus sp. PM-2]
MEYMVIKCGGSIVDQLTPAFYQNIAQLQKEKQINPIIVHGGGPMISTYLKQMNVSTTFVDGLRVTTNEVLDVVEMVLSGAVNKQIVRNLTSQHVKAIGMSGIDGHLLEAVPVKNADRIGYVGNIKKVNTCVLEDVMDQNYIPVISPIALGEQNQRYNINADIAASAVAQALQAKLCFISDIPGILVEENGQKQTLHETSKQEVEGLIKSKVIYGGMIPKVKAALMALEKNVPEVGIVNGTKAGTLIDFIDGKKVGTRIQLEEVSHV